MGRGHGAQGSQVAQETSPPQRCQAQRGHKVRNKLLPSSSGVKGNSSNQLHILSQGKQSSVLYLRVCESGPFGTDERKTERKLLRVLDKKRGATSTPGKASLMRL